MKLLGLFALGHKFPCPVPQTNFLSLAQTLTPLADLIPCAFIHNTHQGQKIYY